MSPLLRSRPDGGVLFLRAFSAGYFVNIVSLLTDSMLETSFRGS